MSLGRAFIALVLGALLVWASGQQHAGAQQVAACPGQVSIVPSLVPPRPDSFINQIQTIVTPPLNIHPVTYDSQGRNTTADPDAFHILYFVDRRVPGAGGVAIADTFNILASGTVTQVPGDASGPARTVVGPRELLVGGGNHRVTAVLVRNDNVVCDARGAIEFSLAGSSDELTTAVSVTAAVAAVVAALAGIAAAMLLHWGRISLDPANPFRLRLGNHEYDLALTKGPAHGVTTTSETEFTVSGGGGGPNYVNPVRVESRVTVHDQFFIVNRDGTEKTVRLKNWRVPLTDKHIVSALQLMWRGAAQDYLLIRNHTGNENTSNNKLLTSRYRHRAGLTRLLEFAGALLAAGAGIAIGTYLASGRASDDVVSIQAAGLSAGFLGFIVGVLVGSLIWAQTAGRSMKRRFFRDDYPKLLAAIDDAPLT